MTTAANGLMSFVDVDGRSAADRVRERAAVDRQLRRWEQLRSDTALRRSFLQAMQRRRTGRLGVLQFDVVPDSQGSEVLAVRGELLIREQDLGSTSVRRLLAAWDLRAVPVTCLDGRVARLVGRSWDARLPELLREIRAMKLPVSIHHVAPMGIVMKGRTGPVPSAWDRSFPGAATGDRTARVAVLDTGIDHRPRTDGWLDGLVRTDNIDLLDALSAVSGELDFGAGHGTFAAGVVQQVAPGAAIRVHRVLDSDGMGSDARIACAMLAAADEGAHIINLSLGTQTIDDEPPLAMQTALELLAERHPDVLVVAAAGNDGSERPCWPAAFPDVVSVAGLTPSLAAAEWSNHGDWVTCSTVAEGVVSTFVEGHRAGLPGEPPAVFGADAWACWTGTSFGAPQVAGVIAGRCAEDGSTPRQALAGLLADRPTVPGYGTVVEILDGT